MLYSEFVIDTKFFGRQVLLAGHAAGHGYDLKGSIAIADGMDVHFHSLNDGDGILAFNGKDQSLSLVSNCEPIVFKNGVFHVPDGIRGVTGKQSVPVVF
jgi:hypothetical protein